MNKVKLNIFKVVRDMVNVVFVKTVDVKNYYTSNCNSYNIAVDRMLSNIIDFEKVIYKYFNKRYIDMYKDVITKEFGLPNKKEEDLGI